MIQLVSLQQRGIWQQSRAQTSKQNWRCYVVLQVLLMRKHDHSTLKSNPIKLAWKYPSVQHLIFKDTDQMAAVFHTALFTRQLFSSNWSKWSELRMPISFGKKKREEHYINRKEFYWYLLEHVLPATKGYVMHITMEWNLFQLLHFYLRKNKKFLKCCDS